MSHTRAFNRARILSLSKDKLHSRKKMNITVAQLAQAVDTLNHVIEQARAKALPVAHQRKLKRLVEAFAPEFRAWEEDRIACFQKYGDLNEDKTQYLVRPAELEAFNTEFNAILAAQVELNLSPLPEEILTGIDLTFDQVSAIDFLLA